MPEGLSEAAVLAGVGVTVVFFTLSILMLAVIALTRLAPGKKKTNENKENAAPGVLGRQGPSNESIAAMAVAMALATEEQRSAPAIEQKQAPVRRPVVSPWSAAGRERLMRSRANTGRKWRRG